MLSWYYQYDCIIPKVSNHFKLKDVTTSLLDEDRLRIYYENILIIDLRLTHNQYLSKLEVNTLIITLSAHTQQTAGSFEDVLEFIKSCQFTTQGISR